MLFLLIIVKVPSPFEQCAPVLSDVLVLFDGSAPCLKLSSLSLSFFCGVVLLQNNRVPFERFWPLSLKLVWVLVPFHRFDPVCPCFSSPSSGLLLFLKATCLFRAACCCLSISSPFRQVCTSFANSLRLVPPTPVPNEIRQQETRVETPAQRLWPPTHSAKTAASTRTPAVLE